MHVTEEKESRPRWMICSSREAEGAKDKADQKKNSLCNRWLQTNSIQNCKHIIPNNADKMLIISQR